METITTLQLLDICENPEHTSYTAAWAELRDRIIPNDFELEYLRGGIRPTHQPINP